MRRRNQKSHQMQYEEGYTDSEFFAVPFQKNKLFQSKHFKKPAQVVMNTYVLKALDYLHSKTVINIINALKDRKTALVGGMIIQ